MVVVPLYDTLGPGAIRYIVNTGTHQNTIISESSHATWKGSSPSASQMMGAKVSEEVLVELLCSSGSSHEFHCVPSQIFSHTVCKLGTLKWIPK